MSNVKAEELLTILSDPDHSEYEETVIGFVTIFSLFEKDFSIAELEKAINQLYRFYQEQFPEDAGTQTERKEALEAIKDERVQKALKQMFYHHILTDGFSGAVLDQYYHLNLDQLVMKITERYDRLLEDTSSSKSEFELKLFKTRYQLLVNKDFLSKIRGKYMLKEFRKPLYRSIGCRISFKTAADIKASFLEGIKDFQKASPEFQEFIKTEEGKQALQTLSSQFFNPYVQKHYKAFLKQEEELGFAAYLEMVQYLQKILKLRIEAQLHLSNYIPNNHYNLDNRTQRREFINEMTKIGPLNAHIMYALVHTSVITEIQIFFTNLLYTVPVKVDEKILNKVKSQLELQFERHLDAKSFASKLEAKFKPFNEKFELIFNKVSQMMADLDRGRDQDLARGIVSAISPFAMIKNIGRILHEESSYRENLKIADQQVLSIYNKYKEQLPTLEKKLQNYYEQYFEEIYFKIFLPFIKNMFKNYQPVRKCLGIDEFKEYIFAAIEEIAVYNKDLELKDLKEFSQYFKPNYFGKKTIRLKS